jgi:hypothetical protein
MIITAETVLCRAPELFSAELHDEVIIMSVQKGAYYGMNEVGRFLWERLAEPVTAGALIDAVQEAFEVDANTCRADVLKVLGKMAEEGFLETR